MAVLMEEGEAAVRHFLRIVAAAGAAEGDDLFGLRRERHMHGEVAALLDEAAGVGGSVDDGGDFGWREVEEANLGGAHGVLAPLVRGGEDDGRAVVEQAVGFVEGDGFQRHGI